MFQNHVQNQTESNVRVGDTIVVYGRHKAKVASVWYDPETARTQIDLDFGEHGKAKVFAHDEGKTWTRLSNNN